LGAQRTTIKCMECGKAVYPMEKMMVHENNFHKACFRCSVCKIVLNLNNFKSSTTNGNTIIFCKTHVPKITGSQTADSISLKNALSAPKVRMAQGIQKDKRTTFGVGELNVGLLRANSWSTGVVSPEAKRKMDATSPITPEPTPVISTPDILPPTIPEPIIPEPVVSQPIIPEPIIPQPVVSEPMVPQPIIPQPIIPEPIIPAPIIKEEEKKDPMLVDEENFFRIMETSSNVESVVPFMAGEELEMAVFWKMWMQSLSVGIEEIQISVSSDLHQIHWESSGTQSLLEPMTKFFIDVGAPSSETDFLHSTVFGIHPHNIGSWIDVSSRGGMDGGWKIVKDHILGIAMQSLLEGEAATKLNNWVQKNQLNCNVMSRDVGESLPRPCEVRFTVPSKNVAEEAWSTFEFPSIPSELMNLLDSRGNWEVVVVATADSFVRLGIRIVPKDLNHLEQLCHLTDTSLEDVKKFGGAFGKEMPDMIEFQHLNFGFGYDVYQEGFQLHFLYNLK